VKVPSAGSLSSYVPLDSVAVGATFVASAETAVMATPGSGIAPDTTVPLTEQRRVS
jgi:hypothetical protein